MMRTEKIGLSAFSTKKAEAEAWLIDHAFVPPPDFEFLKGDHSFILFGGAGAGKTASCMALEQYGVSSSRLVVHWRPQSSVKATEISTTLATFQLQDILRSCAKAFVGKLSNEPSLLLKNLPSVQEYLIWFLKYFSEVTEFLDILPVTISKKEKEQFQVLAKRFSRDLFEDAPDMIIAATEFTKAMVATGYTGVWLIVDGVDWTNDAQKTNAVNSLRSILSTLKLFEIPYLSYKMALPSEFESELADTIAITRDRAMFFRISWDVRYLSLILERRLSLAVGDKISFDQIYNAEEVRSWLEACGGMNPRGWLEYFRPIFSAYWDVASNGKLRKLTKEEWIRARSRSSLNLNFSPETNQVQVGMGMPKILSPEVGAIFAYLYKNKGRYCTKKELYYNAYVPFVTPQDEVKVVEKQDALSKEYDDLINTVIYRIRQVVEPNPKDKEPIFITTKRDVGVRLVTQAFQ